MQEVREKGRQADIQQTDRQGNEEQSKSNSNKGVLNGQDRNTYEMGNVTKKGRRISEDIKGDDVCKGSHEGDGMCRIREGMKKGIGNGK